MSVIERQELRAIAAGFLGCVADVEMQGQSIDILHLAASAVVVSIAAACYVYVLFYALWGAKATAVLLDERLA
jgi:fucose permease